MTALPRQRIQCDRCRTVVVLTAKRSDHWGAELQAANWVARPTRSGGAYRHACALCADEFLAEIDGRRTRYADHTEDTKR
jgi:hypothetical protein